MHIVVYSIICLSPPLGSQLTYIKHFPLQVTWGLPYSYICSWSCFPPTSAANVCRVYLGQLIRNVSDTCLNQREANYCSQTFSPSFLQFISVPSPLTREASQLTGPLALCLVQGVLDVLVWLFIGKCEVKIHYQTLVESLSTPISLYDWLSGSCY